MPTYGMIYAWIGFLVVLSGKVRRSGPGDHRGLVVSAAVAFRACICVSTTSPT